MNIPLSPLSSSHYYPPLIKHQILFTIFSHHYPTFSLPSSHPSVTCLILSSFITSPSFPHNIIFSHHILFSHPISSLSPYPSLIPLYPYPSCILLSLYPSLIPIVNMLFSVSHTARYKTSIESIMMLASSFQ